MREDGVMMREGGVGERVMREEVGYVNAAMAAFPIRSDLSLSIHF